MTESLKVESTKSGIPLITAESTTGNWLIIDGEPTEYITGRKLFRYPLAPSDKTTSYQLGTRRVTHTARAGMGVATSGGEFYPARIIDRGDPVDHDPAVQVFNLASGGAAYRRGLMPPPAAVNLVIQADHARATQIITALQAGGAFIHAGRTDDRLDAVRLVEVTEVQATSNTRFTEVQAKARIRATSAKAHKDGLTAALTMGEACTARAKCNETLEQVIRRANGLR